MQKLWKLYVSEKFLLESGKEMQNLATKQSIKVDLLQFKSMSKLVEVFLRMQATF